MSLAVAAQPGSIYKVESGYSDKLADTVQIY